MTGFSFFFWSALGLTATALISNMYVTSNFDMFYSSGLPKSGQKSKLVAYNPRKKLQRTYLIVYAFMAAGDWLQGPYVYALYEAYGYEHSIIAYLFVLGFGSSMVLGTFIGSLADSLGRKRAAILYAFLYILSCCTKHFRNIFVLAVGRILGGAATSLLSSVFEAWIVCEYSKLDAIQTDSIGYSLQDTFSLSTLVNFFVAITAGLIAEFAVDSFPWNEQPSLRKKTDGQFGYDFFVGGFTAPFDLAIVVLTIGGLLCSTLWDENYGFSSSPPRIESRSNSKLKKAALNDGGFADRFSGALKTIFGNFLVFCVGISQSFFEAAMFCFVFMWTPALTSFEKTRSMSNEEISIPFGQIFATMMLCCMLGSQVFSLLMSTKLFSTDQLLQITFLVAFFGLAIGPLVSFLEDINVRLDGNMQYVGFLLFEFCLGLYYPCMGSLKSRVVPEENRATIYNLFRVPLNLIVLFVLLNDLSEKTTFMVCSLLLGICTVLQFIVNANLPVEAPK